MPVPLKVVTPLIGAAVAQNIRTEILNGQAWCQASGDEVIVIEKLGMFGAVTCTYGLYRGAREVITPEGSALDATAFGNDWEKVSPVNITLLPNTRLLCYVVDSAADPLGVVFAVLGWVFKVAELGARR